MKEDDERYTLSVLVENQPGVLARIAGLFSGRGYNIASLSVGETIDPDISRMTIVVEADAHTLEQCVKQLQKLVVTLKVEDFQDRPYIHAELFIVKVSATPSERGDIIDLADVFDGTVVDVSQSSLTLQFVADYSTIDEVISLLQPYGIKETVRTGTVALARDRS